jgi:hypothetical protein
MDIGWLIVGIIFAVILLFVVIKFIGRCLPKILIVLIVLGLLAYLIIKYFVK